MLMLLGTAALVFGQFNPYIPPAQSQDPRLRRAAREQIVAHVGDEARGLVEAYGDEAVAALRGCSVPVAKRLSLFYSQGELGKFPRPRDFLVMVSNPRNGDDACLWAMLPQNAEKLHDVDYFNAYLAAPLDYALGLSALADGAAQIRSNRLALQSSAGGSSAASPQALSPETDPNVRAAVVVLALATVGIGILMWWKKRIQKAAV